MISTVCIEYVPIVQIICVGGFIYGTVCVNIHAHVHSTVHTPGVYTKVSGGERIWLVFSYSHESSNPGSTQFRSRTEFQSTNGRGLSQSGLQSVLGVFTLAWS